MLRPQRLTRRSAVGLVIALLLWTAAQSFGADRPELAELRRMAEAQEKARAELEQKQLDLLAKQLELNERQLAVFRTAKVDPSAVAAFEALVELKRAELQLKRAAVKARAALAGAQLVAADGQPLGKVAPAYDDDSIFCSWGRYGASYSETSIWCRYGKYGATYEELSPFCAFSAKPPQLVIDGNVVGHVTVGVMGRPIAISPDLLRILYVKTDDKK